jgi:hypothetical protein
MVCNFGSDDVDVSLIFVLMDFFISKQTTDESFGWFLDDDDETNFRFKKLQSHADIIYI